MAQEQEQLVNRIAEQVIASLKSNGVKVRAGDAAAQVRPPAGVCTGDYSKFVELQGRVMGAERSAGASGASPAPTAPSPPPAAADGNGRDGRGGRSADGTEHASPPSAGPVLEGIVTARQLEQAGPVVQLTAEARLTPLAVDYIKEKKLTLCRVDKSASAGPASVGGGNAAATQWRWWIDGRSDAVATLTGQLRDRLRPAGARHQLSSLGAAVREIARQVRQGQAAGGVLFVHSAAQAACFANRCPALRAIVGTCGEAVEQGIQLLGANMLIVEYPHQGPEAMRAMTERFLRAERPELPGVERQLQELRRCD